MRGNYRHITQWLEVPIETASYKFATDVAEGGYKVVGCPAKTDKAFGTLPKALNSAMAKTEKDLTQGHTDRILKAVGTDKEAPIVIFCGYVSCRRSHIGAKILVEHGCKNVYRFPSGITTWQDMGYPVSKDCCKL